MDAVHARMKAKAAAHSAIALKPDLAEPHAALAMVAEHDLNMLKAELEYKTALALNPSDPFARYMYGTWLLRIGYFEEAQEYLLQVLEQDPVSGVKHRWVASSYIFIGDFDSAKTYAQRSMELGDVYIRLFLSDLAEIDGNFEEAKRLAREFEELIGRETPCSEETWAVRQYGVANDQALACLKAVGGNWAFLYMLVGALDEAIQRYPDLIRTNATFMVDFWGTHGAVLQAHQKFSDLLEKLGIIAVWNHRGWPEHCRWEGDHVQCIIPQFH